MGMFFPCLVAACINGAAIQIFREPMKMGNGPLVATYIFIFASFLLLWSVRMYPRNLRKVGKMQFLVEFLIADFLMQDVIIDFWFPLEKFVMEGLPSLGQTIDDWVAGDWNAEVITDLLKNESTAFYASYLMSIFFLVITLHACRIVDLRTLTQEGPVCFFKEIVRKIKLTGKRLLRRFLPGKRRVNINELRNTCQDYCALGPQIQHHPRERKDYCSPQDQSPRRRMRSSCSPAKRYCPVHNPTPSINYSDFSDSSTEDLGKSSC